ncbi:hypothetical protein Scep_011511 [Stephania cephalantha]|uniref:DUF4283 domain-containing protein n=1 Tax=Stephania cephalantha TaxID=152367 RepID=A0AAP0JDI0_9MAGN
MSDDLSISLQHFHLEQQENSELLISDYLKLESTQICNLSLLGRLATQQRYNKNGLIDVFNPKSMNYVLDFGPWLFNDHIFLVKKWSPDSSLDLNDINSCKLWVQLHNLPIECRSEATTQLIAKEPVSARASRTDQQSRRRGAAPAVAARSGSCSSCSRTSGPARRGEAAAAPATQQRRTPGASSQGGGCEAAGDGGGRSTSEAADEEPAAARRPAVARRPAAADGGKPRIVGRRRAPAAAPTVALGSARRDSSGGEVVAAPAAVRQWRGGTAFIASLTHAMEVDSPSMRRRRGEFLALRRVAISDYV